MPLLHAGGNHEARIVNVRTTRGTTRFYAKVDLNGPRETFAILKAPLRVLLVLLGRAVDDNGGYGRGTSMPKLSHTLRAMLAASVIVVGLAGAAVAGPFEDAVAAQKRQDHATAYRLFRSPSTLGTSMSKASSG